MKWYINIHSLHFRIVKMVPPRPGPGGPGPHGPGGPGPHGPGGPGPHGPGGPHHWTTSSINVL